MCTLILLSRPDAKWPLLLAANRDEDLARPWRAPGRHWDALPDVTAGLDTLGGGTWLGVNRSRVVAGVLNRPGTLGPEAGKASRGELPLLALGYRSAMEAAEALARRDAGLWRAFNLVVADASGAFFLRGLGEGRVEARALEPGLHMVTAHDPDDVSSPRIARHLPKFAAALPPAPPDWGSWPALLADSEPPPEAAINVRSVRGFGTGSSALVAMGEGGPGFWFAAGPPGTAPYRRMELG